MPLLPPSPRIGGLADEQAALRQVAVLAAGGAPLGDVLALAMAEISALLGGSATTLLRYDEDGTHVSVAALSADPARIGARYPIEQDAVGERVRRSGAPERVEAEPGDVGEARVDRGPRSAVGVPITVDFRPWGILTATAGRHRLPTATAGCLSQFAELIAAAISTAQTRDDLRRLVEEQSALRRVAELVARGAEVEQLFHAVAVEASRLIGDAETNLVRFDGPLTHTTVATCGGRARVGMQVEIPDDDLGRSSPLLDPGTGSSVSAPILVNHRLWGTLDARTENRRLPTGTERRLQQFADLVAAALANSQARAEIQLLADEQSALRRIAELVAHGASEAVLFDAVALEAAGLVGREATTLVRNEGDRTFTVLATSGGPVPAGARIVLALDDHGAMDRLVRDPARLGDSGSVVTREHDGAGSSVWAPILVEDRLWGMLGVLTRGPRLPEDTKDRLRKFAELVAAALANRQARTELRTLADQQTALRRVANLVARSAPLDEVFDAVVAEASRLLAGLATALTWFEPAGSGTVVATCNSDVPLNLRVRADGDSVAARAFRRGRPVRVSGLTETDVAGHAQRSEVGVPVTVDGRRWATLSASSAGPDLPQGTEGRLEEFAALAAAAIANAQNKAKLTASRARVVATADETRRRLQRDVHDGAQQRLVQTVITLQQAHDALTRGGPVAELVDEALYHAERANAELRSLAQGIMPASLTRGGLRAGLESLLDHLPVPVSLDVDAPRLDAATETTAFFIAAEALTNVVKHAGATRADVRVWFERDVLTVEVSDDGVGGADPARGTGLTGLSDRVDVAEGTLAIVSRPGTGTTLRAQLPVPAPPAARAVSASAASPDAWTPIGQTAAITRDGTRGDAVMRGRDRDVRHPRRDRDRH